MPKPLKVILISALLGPVFALGPAFAEDLLVINDGEFTCELDPSVPININAATGDLEVTVLNAQDCFGSPESPVAPLAPALSRQVLEGQQPGTVRLTWTTSEGAQSCTAASSPELSAWSGNVPLGQNLTRDIEQIPAGSYTLRLNCSNAAGDSPNAEVQFAISEPTTPGACDGRLPPQGWNRITSGCSFTNVGTIISGVDCRIWSSTTTQGIWPADSPFLATSGIVRRLATQPGQKQYLAIEFNTNGLTANRTGQIKSSESGSFNNPRRLWSISECPGDFNPAQPTGCYGVMDSIFHIFWGGTSTSESCRLQPNTTYFLNLIPTDSPLGTSPDAITLSPACEGTRACGAVYSPQNQ